MTERDPDLDSIFAVARNADPVPSDALMGRILADAAALQPRPVPNVRVRPASAGWFDRIAAVFGGGGALAGMSFAAIAGVFIGIVQPAPVAALTSLLADAGQDSVDLLPGSDPLWEE